MSTATILTTTTATPAAEAEAAATALSKMNHPSSTSSSLYSLPLMVSWKHGMAHKASGTKNITVWFDLAMTLDGRDKITKLLQYMARFLAWYYSTSTSRGLVAGGGGSSSTSSCSTSTSNAAALAAATAERFANLKVALTNSRKAFRLGRTLVELQKVYGMNLVQTILERYWQQQQQVPPSSSTLSSTTNNTNINMITLIGTALKCLGLAGFWAGDNINFLAQCGFLDDYSNHDNNNNNNNKHERLQQRQRLAAKAGIFANRSYFIGAVAGLVVNARAYWHHCRETNKRLLLQQTAAAAAAAATTAQENIQMTTTPTEQVKNDNDFQKILDEAQEKQFILFVALLKSCCDTLAFSNNPGVDLWEKYIFGHGHKLNEGIHCVAGLLSACTVLYNNFPNNKNKK
jgi:Peroxisomal biogenesis factor 11 (PEX11)